MSINPLVAGLALIGAWQVLKFGLNLWGDVRWEREVRRVHKDMRRRWEESGAYLDGRTVNR